MPSSAALLIHHIGVRRQDPLPVGTMVVNASGSLLLGILTGLSLYHGFGSHALAVAGTGLCGGYTTWSTASWESIHLSAPATGRRPWCTPLGVARVPRRRRGRPHPDSPALKRRCSESQAARQLAKASGGGHAQTRFRSP